VFKQATWDGAAPLLLTLRDPGHPAGLYELHGVVSVETPAPGAASASVVWGDGSAAAYTPLGGAGQVELAFDRTTLYSDGVAPIVLTLDPAGALAGVLSCVVRATAARVG
jgi:hypothetical protein